MTLRYEDAKYPSISNRAHTGSAKSVAAKPDRFAGPDVNKFGTTGRQARQKPTLRIDPQTFVAPENNSVRSVGNIVRPKAVPLSDDNGDPVMVWNAEAQEEKQVQIPEDVTLNYFARMGLEDRKLSWNEQKARLGNFLWGQPWDLQRPGLVKNHSGEYVNFPEFVDVATIAIGVYAAAAGIPVEELLKHQKFAARFANYGSAVRDPDYAPLPFRNVSNTRLGYYLYLSGKIKPK